MLRWVNGKREKMLFLILFYSTDTALQSHSAIWHKNNKVYTDIVDSTNRKRNAVWVDAINACVARTSVRQVNCELPPVIWRRPQRLAQGSCPDAGGERVVERLDWSRLWVQKVFGISVHDSCTHVRVYGYSVNYKYMRIEYWEQNHETGRGVAGGVTILGCVRCNAESLVLVARLLHPLDDLELLAGRRWTLASRLHRFRWRRLLRVCQAIARRIALYPLHDASKESLLGNSNYFHIWMYSYSTVANYIMLSI